MTSVTDTLKSAFRRAGINAAGRNMTSTQEGVGLERTQGLYNWMVGSRLFGELTPKLLTSNDNYIAKEWEIVTEPAAYAGVVSFPATVKDTDDGNTRAPKDGAMIVVVNPTTHAPNIAIYDAMLGNWQQTQGLVLTDYAPLTHRFDENIKNLLAGMLADDGGYPISKPLAVQIGLAKIALASLRKRESPLEYY